MRNFLVIGRPQIVDGIRKEGISEIGKRRACKWTGRIFSGHVRARMCVYVRKYASLSLDRFYRALSFVYEHVEKNGIFEKASGHPSFAREAKLRGN